MPPRREILRRSQYQHHLDSLPVEMLEVSSVAGQQIIGVTVNRSQQDRLVLRFEPNAVREFETLWCIDRHDRLGELCEPRERFEPIDGQVPAGFFYRISRSYQLDVIECP